MKKSAIVALAAVFIIIGVTFLTSKSSKKSKPEVKTFATSSNTINYSDNGFDPISLQVKSGETVTINNKSSRPLQFSSDDHPTHTKNTELNQSVLSPGKSLAFKVTKLGTYGYHDHLNSEQAGKIIVN